MKGGKKLKQKLAFFEDYYGQCSTGPTKDIPQAIRKAMNQRTLVGDAPIGRQNVAVNMIRAVLRDEGEAMITCGYLLSFSDRQELDFVFLNCKN